LFEIAKDVLYLKVLRQVLFICNVILIPPALKATVVYFVGDGVP